MTLSAISGQCVQRGGWSRHGMAAVNGRVYVIGGSNDERGYRRDVLQVPYLHLPMVFKVTEQQFVMQQRLVV